MKVYYPVSIYKVPHTEIKIAKYPIIDVHSHDYPQTEAAVDEWVKT
ncbi:MAG: amidohydrolase, partial [Flavisolibacter sp.]|nr:amidohydrolase [Flavisolibacter sp.]